jgi:co-chaperonin GroES (HSP10)
MQHLLKRLEKMENNSGFTPRGCRVLVLMEKAEEITESGIVLARETQQKEQNSETRGVMVEAGCAAWVGDEFPEGDWAQPGEKVLLGRFAGVKYIGKDDKEYRIVNDKDILGIEA